jgi:hypothetical protein
MGANVPLNDELGDAGSPDRIADLAAVRDDFEDPWVAWNIVRTVVSTFGAPLSRLGAGALRARDLVQRLKSAASDEFGAPHSWVRALLLCAICGSDHGPSRGACPSSISSVSASRSETLATPQRADRHHP